MWNSKIGILSPIILSLGFSNAEPVAWEKERFAFLPRIFIDVGEGFEYNNAYPQFSGRISNCSRDGVNCLQGRTFNIEWSEVCGPYQVGQSWKQVQNTDQETTFTVAAEFIINGPYFKSVDHVVTSSATKNIAYIFSTSRGLVGVIQDSSRRDTLVDDLASPSLIDEIASGKSTTGGGYIVSRLVGYGKLGNCVPMRPRLEEGFKIYEPVDLETSD
ncbi:hypothetical protein WJT74_04335 [Sphingomicrobium sp. XHP0239]|uniref:hypothetical protein n=1 Tax=Sphingomicrobium maritimum TaxID=3133972 RepID=UPI0031CCC1E5